MLAAQAKHDDLAWLEWPRYSLMVKVRFVQGVQQAATSYQASMRSTDPALVAFASYLSNH